MSTRPVPEAHWLLAGPWAAPPPRARVAVPPSHWLLLVGSPPAVADRAPKTLDEAVYDALRGDAGLGEVFGDRIWADFAPRGVAMPLLVYADLGGQPEYQSRDADGRAVAIERRRYQVVAHAASREVAVAAGDAAGDVLHGAALVFEDGELVEFRRDAAANAMTVKGPAKGPGGADVWSRLVPFLAVVQRSA